MIYTVFDKVFVFSHPFWDKVLPFHTPFETKLLPFHTPKNCTWEIEKCPPNNNKNNAFLFAAEKKGTAKPRGPLMLFGSGVRNPFFLSKRKDCLDIWQIFLLERVSCESLGSLWHIFLERVSCEIDKQK